SHLCCIHPTHTETYTLSHTTLFRSPEQLFMLAQITILPAKPRPPPEGNAQPVRAGLPFRRTRDRMCRTTGLFFISGLKRENNLRSEEHTSELQSRENLVCRLLLEKK